MKLKQVNKELKCPTCGRYTMVKHHGYEDLWDEKHGSYIRLWDYICTNCNAKFIII